MRPRAGFSAAGHATDPGLQRNRSAQLRSFLRSHHRRQQVPDQGHGQRLRRHQPGAARLSPRQSHDVRRQSDREPRAERGRLRRVGGRRSIQSDRRGAEIRPADRNLARRRAERAAGRSEGVFPERPHDRRVLHHRDQDRLQPRISLLPAGLLAAGLDQLVRRRKRQAERLGLR